MVPFGKRPKTLPIVLSRNEVDRLLKCTPPILKQRTFLTTLYATGLRFSEEANLRIQDIDSDRMVINVACGKGKKERQVPLSPRLLKELRVYWTTYRPAELFFPGKDPAKPYAGTTIQKTIKKSAKRAGIKKTVYPHVLRHSYATGLLDAGPDRSDGFRFLRRVSGNAGRRCKVNRVGIVTTRTIVLSWFDTASLG